MTDTTNNPNKQHTQEEPAMVVTNDFFNWLVLCVSLGMMTFIAFKWQYAAVIVVVLILTIYWLAKFEIRFYNDYFFYKKRLLRPRKIAYSQIELVEFKRDYKNRWVSIRYEEEGRSMKLGFEDGDIRGNNSLKHFFIEKGVFVIGG